MPVAGGTTTVYRAGTYAAAGTTATAATRTAASSSFWRPLVYGGATVGTVAVAGPWLGDRAGDTAEELAEGLGGALKTIIQPLAAPAVVIGLGFLAYTFLVSRK